MQKMPGCNCLRRVFPTEIRRGKVHRYRLYRGMVRTGGSTFTEKVWRRDLDIGNSLPETLYVSMMINHIAGTPFEMRSESTDGTDSRRFGFNVSDTGEIELIGTGSDILTQSSGILQAGQPNFIVLKLQNNEDPSMKD